MKQGLSILSYFPQTKDHPARRIITEELIDQSYPWAYFDGASQDNKSQGGVTLFINHSHHFQIQMGLGNGTNNFAELMALKLLLCFAIERGYRRIQVFGLFNSNKLDKQSSKMSEHSTRRSI